MKNRRCIIVGAGDFYGIPVEIQKDDLVIAADAGYEYLKDRGIRPDLIIGDFDSMQVKGVKGVTGPVSGLSIFADAEKAEYIHHLKHMEIDGVETRVINPVKNDPDMMACVRIGLAEGCREMHLLGGTGKRVDHSIANLQILGFLASKGCRGYLYGQNQVITAIRNTSVCFSGTMQGYLSVFSLTDTSEGVTETGLKYVVEDVTLNNLTPTGLSNEFVGTEATVSVRNGTLLLVYEYHSASCM
ncbi:MAG: thiamine diphosphokinase [Oribacterium sp.]|nr:thiamine diphosphokinase [Oribacterium sp.]